MSDNHSHSQEKQGLLSPFLAQKRYSNISKFISKNDIVLDLGCGSGELKKHLKSKTQYYGLDSEKQWNGSPDHLFKVQVGGNLPKAIEKKKFNVVTALALIEHLKKPVTLFDDASKVLGKGGRFMLTTPHPLGRKAHDLGASIGVFSNHARDEHETFLDRKGLENLANQAGFKLVAYKRFLFGMNQVAVFEKK